MEGKAKNITFNAVENKYYVHCSKTKDAHRYVANEYNFKRYFGYKKNGELYNNCKYCRWYNREYYFNNIEYFVEYKKRYRAMNRRAKLLESSDTESTAAS